MFRRTYRITKNGHFSPKAVDFENNMSFLSVGSIISFRGTTQIWGLEYQGQIFPVSLGSLRDLGVTYNSVKACDLFLSTHPESYYFTDDNNPFFVDKEKLVFDYATIEQYEEIMALCHDALNVLTLQYGSFIGSSCHPKYLFNVKYESIPHNMKPKNSRLRTIEKRETLLGSVNNPEDLELFELSNMLEVETSKWNTIITQENLKIINNLGGVEKIRKVKKDKEEYVCKLLTSYVDAYTSPKSPNEIVQFFENKKILSTDETIAELIQFVAVGSEKYHQGPSISSKITAHLTSSAILKILKLCYEKELSDIFNSFDYFLVQLSLQLESECYAGNESREFFRNEALKKNHRNSYEKARQAYNRMNRYKFWKTLK